MVDAAPTETFGYTKKNFIFMQGQNGNIDKYIKAYKEKGLLDETDKNTVINRFTYPITNKMQFLYELSQLETKIYKNLQSGKGFLHGVYSGDAWSKGGTVIVDMGYGPFPVQKKLTNFCGGGANLATWCHLDCSREIIVGEAATGGHDEWLSDDESQDGIRGPLFITYACREGTAL